MNYKQAVVKKKYRITIRKKGLLSKYEYMIVEADSETNAKNKVPSQYKIISAREVI